MACILSAQYSTSSPDSHIPASRHEASHAAMTQVMYLQALCEGRHHVRRRLQRQLSQRHI